MSTTPPSTRRSMNARTWVAVCGIGITSLASLGACASAPTDPAPGSAPSTASSLTAATSATRTSGRPNVVLITADDASVGDLDFMPHTQQLLADKGVTITQAIAPTPICVPARASILTGQYAHNHGARTIKGPHGGFASFNDKNTLPVWLRKAGYDTLFAGKYVNGYGLKGTARYRPPGWRDWRATVDNSTYSFWQTKFSVNGRVVQPKGYSTDLISNFSSAMLKRQHARSNRPFFMWANYVAPHHGGPVRANDPRKLWPGHPSTWLGNTDPAPQDRNKFPTLQLPKVPEMWERDIRGNHFAHGPRGPLVKKAMRVIYRQRIQALQAVDRSVARTVATLRHTGQLANTYVIFTSDNGYLTGHHNKDGKLIPYDRSLRIPIVIRGPGVPAGRALATTVTNPDLGVSIAAAAGAKPGRAVDGINVLPLLNQPAVTRPVLIEGWKVSNGNRLMYNGVRDGQYTYFKYRRGYELYDRSVDPGELTNVINKPQYAAVQARLEKLRQQLANCRGASCRPTV